MLLTVVGSSQWQQGCEGAPIHGNSVQRPRRVAISKCGPSRGHAGAWECVGAYSHVESVWAMISLGAEFLTSSPTMPRYVEPSRIYTRHTALAQPWTQTRHGALQRSGEARTSEWIAITSPHCGTRGKSTVLRFDPPGVGFIADTPMRRPLK